MDETPFPRRPWQDLGIDLHSRARIAGQEREEQTSGLCAWREGVEDGGDFGEVSCDHLAGLCDYQNIISMKV